MSESLHSIIQKYAVAESLAVDVKMFSSAGPECGKAFIYSFYHLDRLSDAFAAGEMHRLPELRKKKCERYKRQVDKKACIFTYLLLKEGLMEQYGISDVPQFVYNEHGKPYLRDTPNIFFNFSHSGNAAACALANFEIGLDIQEIRPLNKSVARKVCSDKELRQLEESDDADRLFCRFWTQKESCAKAKGVGVAGIYKDALPPGRFAGWDGESYCMTLYC